jgi:hypothetical protein
MLCHVDLYHQMHAGGDSYPLIVQDAAWLFDV